MPRPKKAKPQPQAEDAEVFDKTYECGHPGTPGHEGPYPGPWFRLAVKGKVFRGRYTEPHVWMCDSGEKLSTLEGRLMSGGKPPQPDNPEQHGSWYEPAGTDQEPVF